MAEFYRTIECVQKCCEQDDAGGTEQVDPIFSSEDEAIAHELPLKGIVGLQRSGMLGGSDMAPASLRKCQYR
jgi:hypothetical protein